jgi:hypothetical protein
MRHHEPSAGPTPAAIPGATAPLSRSARGRTAPRWLRGLLVAALPLIATAQTTDPLPPETLLVTASGAPTATTLPFTVAAVTSGAQPDLVVTFTDYQTPAALASASVVVTQGATLVASTSLASGATTATLALPAAVGQYLLRVVGAPNATIGVGTFFVCVAQKSTPSTCIDSTAGNLSAPSASNPAESTLALTLTVTTAGAYTFTYTDDQFPAALSSLPQLALFQGAQPVSAPQLAASPATLTLAAGTYTLLAIAEANTTTNAGLYGIQVTGPNGVAPLVDASYPVGTLAAASSVTNPSTQDLTLSVTDFQFPAALTTASTLVTAGATVLGTAASGSGAATLTAAPAGALQVWTYAAAGTGAGTYEVDLSSAATSASISQTAYGVAGGGAQAYAFVSPSALAAGKYTATANDFQFPAALNSVQFAVAQDDAILQQASAIGAVNFTAAAGSVVLLIAATPGASGSGLVDANVQTAGSTPQLVFDRVQTISTGGSFSSQQLSLGVSGNFDVTLTDLMFPAQFQSLALVGTSQGAVLGKIYGGGTFTIDATPGTYQFTVVALPGGAQSYGLYGLQIVNSAPTVTLSASPTSVTAGGLTTLTWTTTNATACTGSGGNFTGSQAVESGSASITVAATTTFTLSCTGPGGTAEQTVTVTATQAAGRSGGGGAIGLGMLGILGSLVVVRARGRTDRLSRRG